MCAVTLGTNIKFGTWDQIEAIPENGFKQTDIHPFWIIGDVDVERPLSAHYSTDAKNKAINRVLNDGACPVLLLHQKGETSVLSFPPRFNDKPASGGRAAAGLSRSGAGAEGNGPGNRGALRAMLAAAGTIDCRASRHPQGGSRSPHSPARMGVGPQSALSQSQEEDGILAAAS
jgi:hypothetical protein